jgi:Bacterial PH domain
MSYIKNNVLEGETIAYETHLHWVVMIGYVLLSLLVLGISAGLLAYGWAHRGPSGALSSWLRDLSAALAGVALIIFIAGSVRRFATEMAVTTRRVVVKKGLASRSTIEMLLNKVESIEVRETMLGRLLGYGTVVLIGTGGTSEPFRNMAHPLEFRAQVQRQLEARGKAAPATPS